MNKPYDDALRYLSTPAGSFWKWDDQGSVVVWAKGSTIAFREEVAIVLRRLASEGLPPLDAVLLLIGATRAYWRDDSQDLRHRLWCEGQQVPFRKNPFNVTTEISRDDVKNAIDSRLIGVAREVISELGEEDLTSRIFSGLDAIHALPESLIGSAQSKSDLVAVVFELAPRVASPEVARIVCEVLEKRLNDALPNLPKLSGSRAQTTKSLRHDLWPLSRGLEGLTKESLLLRYKTGLDTEPELATIDFSVERPAMRSFLAQLARDDEFGGLARLIRNLSAVIQLPRALLDSNELPIGGVSDLTNRGTLDRLLISELALDDLMLATRVALNEALYLRREAPPSFPSRHRHVLIDAGLRMWGLPRVFSTAVVMSFVATLEKDSSLSAFHASGSELIPVDLATREGLVAHLAALEPEVHPGRSLAPFFQCVAESDLQGDVILVTTEAVLTDPDFQRALRESEGPPHFVATVNRDGDFQLWSQGPRGRKCHTTLRLDLDELLKPRSRSLSCSNVTLIDPSVDPDLPAMLRTQPFPFRLPYLLRGLKQGVTWSVFQKSESESTREPCDNKSSGKLARAVFELTRDYRLIMFDRALKGAMLLGEGLPFGKCLHAWAGDEPGQSFALIHRESDRTLYLLEIDAIRQQVQSGTLDSVQMTKSGSDSKIKGVTVHGSFVFVIFHSQIETFDVVSRSLINSYALGSQFGWMGQRFFFNAAVGHENAWYALTYDGIRTRFDQVPLAKTRMGIIRLFERPGMDGPFAVSSHGVILNLSDQTEGVFSDATNASIRVLDIDNDGERVLLQLTSSFGALRESRVVDTRTCLTTKVENNNVASLIAYDAARVPAAVQPIRRLTSVVIRNEQLTVLSKGLAAWHFQPRTKHLVMVNLPDSEKTDRLYRQVERGKHSRDSIGVVQWDDGSRIWIDSQGLLHLKSSDPQIPETSMLLNVNSVVVWTNDGRTLGTSYYLDNATSTISPEDVVEQILTPFVLRLR